MLTDCRAVRVGTADYRCIQEHYRMFMPAAGGNLAFFEIRCDGAPPRTAQTMRSYDPGRATVYYSEDRDRWYVFARNVPRGEHSEAVCARLFRSYFAGGRRAAKITFVWTEREPCHGAGSKECHRLLYTLLVNQGYGAEGAGTPVRFRTYYKSRAESATAAEIGRKDRKRVNQEDREEGRLESKRMRLK